MSVTATRHRVRESRGSGDGFFNTRNRHVGVRAFVAELR